MSVILKQTGPVKRHWQAFVLIEHKLSEHIHDN